MDQNTIFANGGQLIQVSGGQMLSPTKIAARPGGTTTITTNQLSGQPIQFIPTLSNAVINGPVLRPNVVQVCLSCLIIIVPKVIFFIHFL